MKIYKFIQVVVLFVLFLTASSLKGQQKELQAIAEGYWKAPSHGNSATETGQYYTHDSLVVIGVQRIPTNNKPVVSMQTGETINGPILVLNMNDSAKQVYKNTNWAWGILEPLFLIQSKLGESVYYVFDDKKGFRATLRNDSIVYELIFEAIGDESFWGVTESENYTYFWGSWHSIIVCDANGNFIKKVDIGINKWISKLTSLEEHEGEVLIGYSSGAQNDGRNFGSVDLSTGVVTRKASVETNGNNSITLWKHNGVLYAEANRPDKYLDQMQSFGGQGVFYRREAGDWKPIVIGIGLPTNFVANKQENYRVNKIPNGKLVLWLGEGYEIVETGKVITKSEAGYYYFENGQVSSKFEFDQDWYLHFSEAFEGEFYHRHQEAAYVDFFYTYNGTKYAFGASIVAKVADKNVTGVDEVTTANLAAYPNPATSILNISNLVKETEYTVLNNLGQTVASGTTNGTIDVTTIIPGVYFLNIANTTIKIVKQ